MPDWRERAACKDADPHIFFDEARSAEAKAVCAGCPVVAECGAYGRKEPGVWGGTTKAERVAQRHKANAGTVRGRGLSSDEESRLLELGGAERRDEAVRLYKNGVTQSALARSMGVNQSTISKWLKATQLGGR